MKVADWISYEEAEGLTESFGGMGGWFGHNPKATKRDEMWSAPHTWADYLEQCHGAEGKERAEALRDAIVAGRIWEDGGWHQGDDHGTPRFDDGTVATFSFRAWGDLLAAVWTQQLGRQYCYMDFYYGGTADRPPDFEARASMGVKR